MSVDMLILRGREYVLVPRKEYDRLTETQQDRRDAAKVHKALARLRAGKSKAAPLAEVKRRLGL